MLSEQLKSACTRYMRVGDYERALDCIDNAVKEVKSYVFRSAEVQGLRQLTNAFRTAMKQMISGSDDAKRQECYELLHRSYVIWSYNCFDDFMVSLEWYRKPAEKFWLPRREQLL